MLGGIARGAIQAILGPAIDRLLPDREGRKKAERELESVWAAAEIAADEAIADDRKAQLEINLAEAAHKSLFVAGWRPAMGWICVLGLFWSFLGQPFADTILDIAGSDILLPAIPEDRIWELVVAMLGMGTLRSVEKIKSVARNR